MKKIFWLIIGIILSFSFTCYAKEYQDKFDEVRYINDYVVKSKNGIKKYQQMTMMERLSDGNFVYCIEPGIAINSDNLLVGSDMNQSEFASISKDTWKRISLLAYYGYGYSSHTDIKWYTITQFMIWQTVNNGYDIYFTDTLNGKRISKYTSEMKEMEDLLIKHDVVPDFGSDSFKLRLGESMNLVDKNNVLSLYDVSSNNNFLNIQKSTNSLTLSAVKAGNTSVTLTKKDSNLEHPAIVYVHPVSQDIVVRGSYDEISINLDVQVSGGSISIRKLDKDTNSSIPFSKYASLEGAIYGVYTDNHERIGSVTTKMDGSSNSFSLSSLGKYYIKEEVAPTGYVLDSNIYYFDVTRDNLDVKLEVFDNIIKSDIEITKVLSSRETGLLVPEVGVSFGIFDDSGNLFEEVTTDKHGNINITLPYGRWHFKQLIGTSGYEKVSKFTVEVKNSDSQKFVLADNRITSKLKVIKIDSVTKEVIKLNGIRFKIKDLSTNEYVCQRVSYPIDKEICEYETNSEGYFITPLEIISGKYLLEEIDQKIDGYLWNSAGIIFEISEDSNFIETSDGLMLEIYFENDHVKTEVTIEKIGEELILENNSYSYKEIPLDGVKFDLFTSNDKFIKSFEVIDGKVKLENLPLGKYYIIERETVNGHVKDNVKHYFELNYIDQYTELVIANLVIKNYLPKGKLEFNKVDIDTNQGLSDTKIEIYTNNNKLVYSGFTDIDGKIILENLSLGKYYIIETIAKDGYELSSEKQEFEITNDNEIISVTRHNNKLIIPVPRTDTYDYMNCTGLILFTLGILNILYEKTFKKKNLL